MKISILLVFCGVLLAPNYAAADKCYPIPGVFLQKMLQCFSALEKEDQLHLLAEEESDKREVKCFHLCLLEKTGYYKDGEFAVDVMKRTVHKYIPDDKLANDIIATTEDSMQRAKKIDGDNCDVAHEYFKLNMNKEKERPLVTKAFCTDEEEEEKVEVTEANDEKIEEKEKGE